MKMSHRIIRALFNRGLNNSFVNNILIALKLDARVSSILNWYPDFEPEAGASLQKIAGFSDRPEINEMLARLHGHLERVTGQYLNEGQKVLDIGCGPGLYLKDLEEKYQLSGLDISPAMIRIAQKELPNSKFFTGDFMKTNLGNEKFDLIYSIGVLIYFSRSSLPNLFKKVAHHLNTGGTFMLSYPHALSAKDTQYPDLSYVQYSPRVIEKLVKKHFHILEHRHGFDDRVVDDYDRQPYQSLREGESRTYKNSYLLVAQKK